MQRIEDIESAIQGLSSAELEKFRVWYDAFDADRWDKEFSNHAPNGSLDRLADQALEDFVAGRCSEL